MSKNGILISVAGDQNGSKIEGSGRNEPKIITPDDPFPIDNTPYQIGRFRVPGATPFGSYGERDASSAESNFVVWPNGPFQIPPATGVQMSIVSTSGNDALAGTNVQTIEIHYLDSNLEDGVEILEMDGLTPVLTTATDIRFIQCMHIQQFGDTAEAAGDITASYDDGGGPVTYSQISQGDTRCSSSARMIPANKYGFVAGAVAGAVSGTSAARVTVRLVASELDNNQYLDEQFMLIPHGSVSVQDTSLGYNFPIPLRFNPGTVIALTLSTDKAAIVSGSWFGWTENKVTA